MIAVHRVLDPAPVESVTAHLDQGGGRGLRAALELGPATTIERLEGGAASASLRPMSSYERKLVHDIVAERGYTSESEGEGRDRHTVIRAR